MELYSNRVANYFLNKLNLKKGDCVALFNSIPILHNHLLYRELK